MEKIESIETILDEFCRRNLAFEDTVGILKFRMWLLGVAGCVVGFAIGWFVKYLLG